MLDDDHRVGRVHEPLQHLNNPPDIGDVQADGGFFEDEKVGSARCQVRGVR